MLFALNLCNVKIFVVNEFELFACSTTFIYYEYAQHLFITKAVRGAVNQSTWTISRRLGARCSLGTDTSFKFGTSSKIIIRKHYKYLLVPVRTRSNHRGDVRCWIKTLTTVYDTRSRTSIGPADHSASDLSYTDQIRINRIQSKNKSKWSNKGFSFLCRNMSLLPAPGSMHDIVIGV